MPNIRTLCAALVAVALAVSLHASSPRFFQAAAQPDFLKGEVQDLSIDNRGQLRLGPSTDLVYETPAPFLWSMLPAADGSIFIGTGNEGKVFRVDPQGKASTFFDAAELEVHALAPAPNGGLYVGTSPDGKIYKVDRNGTATTFFEPGEKYIWALTTDAKGNLYAATGAKGIVYKISPDGKGAAFYDSKATHVTALAFDKAGELLVGTESPGRVLRVDANGKAFLLLDTPFQEIHALRFDDKGVLYVAAVSGRSGSGAAPPPPPEANPAQTSDAASRPPIAVVTTEVTAITVDSSGASAADTTTSSHDDKRVQKGAVYRVTPDGLWDEMWQSSDDSPYDVAFDAQDRVIIATGSKGKIFRLEGDPPQPTLVTRAAAEQVTSLFRNTKGDMYYATANPGKLYRLTADLAPKGTYESEPRDAQVVASWGIIRWRGTFPAGTSVDVATRSGNTETPDDTWSDWSAPYATAAGSPITSPKARYLQWRATLTGSKGQTPILTSVTAAYLQRNLRPEVHSITVHPPGIVFQKPYSTGDPDLAGFDNQTTPDRKLANAAMTSQSSSSALGRRTYQKGLQTLVWRADDQNDDELTYEVDYRREGDNNWTVLQKGLDESILVWDTTTVPNGTYFVRVIASDAPSNSTDTALTGDLVSTAFEIDNTPPVIAVKSTRTENGRTLVTFDVTDDHSPIQRVEYSMDGRDWKPVFPLDGIADSQQEHYELTLAGTAAPRTLSIRATDTMNNVATIQVP
jgi:sugar lactone lactonase YvrE